VTPENLYEAAVDLAEGETQAHYAKWAGSYDQDLDQNRYAQPERCADAVERFVPGRDARVLDLGCGTGLAGAALRCRGYTSIVGCDYSPEMLAEAAKTEAYGRLFEADLNAHPLAIPDNSYDLIVAVGVVGGGHVHADVVDEVVRILVDGRSFVICLNEPWWFEGSLQAKIGELEVSGAIVVDLVERGEHMPSHDVMGWVIVGRAL
jgi:predicted TPR repeat methyltransferase